jgi:ribosomal protein S18
MLKKCGNFSLQMYQNPYSIFQLSPYNTATEDLFTVAANVCRFRALSKSVYSRTRILEFAITELKALKQRPFVAAVMRSSVATCSCSNI